MKALSLRPPGSSRRRGNSARFLLAKRMGDNRPLETRTRCAVLFSIHANSKL